MPGPSRSPPRPSPQFSPVSKSKPLSPDTSLIPGETEEDGALRREYVLVGDRQAVEINRAVDGELHVHVRPPIHTLIVPMQKSHLGADLCVTLANRRP